MNTDNLSKGNVLGATLLVAGCCIGAGMLGLPVITAPGGFVPTLFLFTLSWLFMAATGLLLLEVNLWFSEEVGIVSMAAKTIGRGGKWLAWLLFTFLFYSLMVAYASGAGQLVADFVKDLFSIVIPEWVGSLFFSLAFGVFLYIGTQSVDRINRVFMGGLIASYVMLIGMGSVHVDWKLLTHQNWSVSLLALPVMIISFGFHNLVPSLTTYLKRDRKSLRFAILVGSAIPLVIYLAWEWVILGIVPMSGNGGLDALSQENMATRCLRLAMGSAWIVGVAEYFAFFAIVTSFLSVALSFVDFLADGLHVKKDAKGKIGLCVLTLTPPFAFSLLYPKAFLSAMRYAGAFGTVILFGVLPALMVWSGRYVMKIKASRLLPGGRWTLLLVILISLGVFLLEIIHQFM